MPDENHPFKAGGPADDPDLCRSCYRTINDPIHAMPKTEVADMVNHPPHYNAYQGVEIIDLVEQMNFNKGNAIKYIARAGLKNAATEIQDLEKAMWYTAREIERLRKQS